MGPPAAVAEVRVAVRRVLRGLDADALVLVACSGGADSVALAAATAFEAPRCGVRAGAVTVDHQLQPRSGDHAQRVAVAMRELGLAPVEVLTVRPGAAGGPEAAARAARYAALDHAAERLDAAAVLLGHTRDDQAETVLLGLARGSGARSLSGMAPAVGRYRRPLLELARPTVRAAAAGLRVWHDPHNDDDRFARTRVRGHALPALEDALGPGVAAALARTARLLRADADALDALAVRAFADVCADDGSGERAMHASALVELPEALRTRVLRLAALAAGSAPTDLSADHVSAVDALLTAWHGQGPIELPQGVRVSRSRGRLRFEQTARGGADT